MHHWSRIPEDAGKLSMVKVTGNVHVLLHVLNFCREPIVTAATATKLRVEMYV